MMRERVGREYFYSKGKILNQDSLIFKRILVFVCLFKSTSAQAHQCSVLRWRSGDKISFYNYTQTCNYEENPCRQMNSKLIPSSKGCICQCFKSHSTYREDLNTCIGNKESRDGCTLHFSGERADSVLRIFNRSSSIRLYTLPREDCDITGTSYLTATSSAAWKKFLGKQPPFRIHHEDTKIVKHAHFLKWNGRNSQVQRQLFGKIVKVFLQCTSRRDSKTPPKNLCILFKVMGSTRVPCQVSNPSSPTLMTTLSSTSPTKNTTEKKDGGLTVPVTIPREGATTPTTEQPSFLNEGEKEFHDVGSSGLPVWLIAVVAGGAVIVTLSITATLWICWKMKQRSRRKRKKSRARLHVGNALYNQEGETVLPYTPPEGQPSVDEAGYAKVGSPMRKGYAFLKPAPDRCRSEYQKLIKPNEDHSGYLLPLEETGHSDCQSDGAIYSEPQSSKPPQDKPKNKDYDYAKPEGIIVLTASRTSLDNLDSHRHAGSEHNEGDYVATREADDPSSPIYTTVQGPNSPGSPKASSEEPSQDNECNDYIEVLPD